MAAGLLVIYLIGFGLYLNAILSYPYSTHYEDGVVLDAAMNVVKGGNLYPDNAAPPYSATIYTPLHYLIFSGPLAFLGPSLVVPRAITLLSTLLLALLIYRWVKWRTGDWRAGLFGAGILLTFFPVANWAAAAKADTTAALLSMLGAYLVDRNHQGRRLWLAPLLMALAFYTKQSQLAAPLAAGLFLLTVAPRRAFGFGAIYLSAVGGPFLLLDLLTNHGLYRHVVEYGRAQPLWLWHAKQLFKTYLLSHVGYFLLAAAGAMALLRKPRSLFLPLYLATSFMGAASVLASGSDFNHFTENAAVLSLVAGIGLGRALSARVRLLALGAATLLVLQLVLRIPSVVPGLTVPWLTVPEANGRGAGITEPPLWAGMPNQEARATGDRLMAEFAAAPGPVLAELAAFPVLAGRRSELDDPFMFAELHKAGKWSQDAFVSRLESGEIALIALLVDVRPAGVHHTRLTDEMISAVRNNYSLVGTLPFPVLQGPRFYLYRPNRVSELSVDTSSETGNAPSRSLAGSGGIQMP